jgi:hypothetical protein
VHRINKFQVTFPYQRQLGGLLFALLCATTTAFSIPQFTILTGNRCSNCHVAETGGGQRSHLGWYARHDIGLLGRETPWLTWLYPEDQSNEYFDNTLLLGTNIRVQTTRSFVSADAPRATFPMQATLTAAFQPIKALTVEGGFNFAALRKAPNSNAQVRFPGQRLGWLSTIIAPSEELPTVRLGFFRPGYGMRYDDHTVFPVSYISGLSRLNYLAPDWAEYGGEVTYERLLWLSANAGVFGSEGLSQIRLSDGEQFVSAVSGNAPTIATRLIFWPRFLEGDLNTYIGGSYMFNGDFSLLSFFGAIGYYDEVYLMADVSLVDKTNVQSSVNVMTEVGWNLYEPIIAYLRFEHGTTEQAKLADRSTANSGIIGAQVTLMPFVEVRPEYRMFDTSREGVATRWNVQLHIYY